MLFWISVGVALLTAVLLFRLFFSDLAGLMEALFRPNSATLKLGLWLVLAIVMGMIAYHTLPRQFPRLGRNRDAKATTATEAKSKPAVVRARTNAIPMTNTAATPPPPPAVATSHGVKLGDTVQISAIHPPVALRSATITSFDETQVTVFASSGSYTILWKDLTGLKAAPTAPSNSTR